MHSMQEWQQLILCTPPGHIPVLPKITLDDLTQAEREEVIEMYHSRNWEFCHMCWRTGEECVLKKCAGCGTFRSQYALYCSRKSQHRGWPEHKELCTNVVSRSTQLAIDAGVALPVWQNINRLQLKRHEGMKSIVKWAFDQVLAINPRIDWRKTCLSIFSRSCRDGKGPIFPESFRLQPLVESPWGSRPIPFEDNETKLGVAYVYIDGVCQNAQYLRLEYPPDPASYIPQWPWIFATVLGMQNHNEDLGEFRLQLLITYVKILVDAKKLDVLQFVAPPRLGDGNSWDLYKFEDWQAIFGDCIGL